MDARTASVPALLNRNDKEGEGKGWPIPHVDDPFERWRGTSLPAAAFTIARMPGLMGSLCVTLS